jgi:hypothetical protein
MTIESNAATDDGGDCDDRFDKKWNLDGEGRFRPPSRWQRLWGTSQFRELEKCLTRELRTADAIERELEESDLKGIQRKTFLCERQGATVQYLSQ